MEAKVFDVESVSAITTRRLPPDLIVKAKGRVPTGGWSDGRLVPRMYVAEPTDGIWDMDFIATAPNGLATDVMCPISGSVSISKPNWCRGVRVHTSTNSKEVQLEYSVEIPDISLLGQTIKRDPGDAWPWVVKPAEMTNDQRVYLAALRGDQELLKNLP